MAGKMTVQKLRDNHILAWISLKSGKQEMHIKCFQNTSLRDTVYIKVSAINELLSFGFTHKTPYMYYWEDYEKTNGIKSTRFKMHEYEDCLSLDDLIKDCEEIQDYVAYRAVEYLM